MNALIEDNKVKSELIRKGSERLKQFSWEKNVKELIKTFHAALNKN
jgi:glycosyltransferase involved in cell wall biosynthesis